MKVKIQKVSGFQPFGLEIDAAISFMPFIRFVERRAREESTLKASFYEKVLQYFHEQNIPEADIPLDDIHRYEGFFEHIFGCVSPVLVPEKELIWGLSFPLNPRIFYGTDLLLDLLSETAYGGEQHAGPIVPSDSFKERMHFIYGLIMQRLYNFQVPERIKQHLSQKDEESGLLRYYEAVINTDFVEITPKEELPVLDFSELYSRFSEENGYLQLEKVLPLSLFRFRGFAVLTLSDVTSKIAVENIRKVRLNRIPGQEQERYKQVIESLKTLVGNHRIQFDLFPLVRVNNRAVYGYEHAGTGVVFKVWGESRMTPETFAKQAESYAAKPLSFYSPDIGSEKDRQIAFLDAFRSEGVRSLALLPIFFGDKTVGVLCMHTWQDEIFDEKALAKLDPAFESIAQLFQIYIDEFNLELETTIKEKFTSIQPAVQWKFNEAAWHTLHRKKKQIAGEEQIICFREVYPLYGAIDIRNSTTERNAAIREDLSYHLELLADLLATLLSSDNSAIMQEFVYTCKKWHQTVHSNEWSNAGEHSLTAFLDTVREYLTHLSQYLPDTDNIISGYLEVIQDENGAIFKYRRAFETSMQMVNAAVNNYFDSEKDKLQQPYPCYFEKFRTDGVEYDIYIGQSISPDIPFNHFHLKNLRLWQLSSMIAIAKLTYALRPEMPTALHTTQLIFVHNHTIDISFRADERKFDVEGAYNIRYQMTKKRIDKVHIRSTGERLTQPDKLAMIFVDKRDIEIYLPFIQYLQKTEALGPEIEELELEDLQGVSGLHALRLEIL